MGYKIVILFIISAKFLFAQSPYPEIDNLIEKVKIKRIGLDKKTIKKLKNPFVSEKRLKIIKLKALKKNIKRGRIRFRLDAIFSTRARINGRWYSLGSKIGGYKLSKIGRNYVVLFKRKRELRLFLHHRAKRKLIKTWSK